jgi:hypothetical protein
MLATGFLKRAPVAIISSLAYFRTDKKQRSKEETPATTLSANDITVIFFGMIRIVLM